ncbi:MAG: AbrB/MazE/SpoVT family DNA-binding domain-containing protein [Nitrosopumilus sp.]|nr:AbrB/MazE/SpoVT family DNA-binding domain-containing protein [Nitrosopumilus sp.]MDH5659259.1 AbrB/MazE/SpoVT family DNA-binding domain-containing protein [Nitrosopumilus sp.]
MTGDNGNTKISKVVVTGKRSYAIVLPKEFANQLGISRSSHIVKEKVPTGLLIRELEMSE